MLQDLKICNYEETDLGYFLKSKHIMGQIGEQNISRGQRILGA